MDSLFFAVPVLGVLGLLFALFQGQKILKEDSGKKLRRRLQKARKHFFLQSIGSFFFLFAAYFYVSVLEQKAGLVL